MWNPVVNFCKKYTFTRHPRTLGEGKSYPSYVSYVLKIFIVLRKNLIIKTIIFWKYAIILNKAIFIFIDVLSWL